MSATLPLTRRITQGELEGYLWGAATRLRGVIDAGDYKQFIFPLLFFRRLCDVYDEEYAAALEESGGDETYAAFTENHRFVVPQGAHWKDMRETTSNLGLALQGAMRAIESANADTLFGIFGDAQWTNKERLSDAILRDLIEHFSTLTLSVANVPEDELGVAYEFLIKKFADDSGHTAAEFYTNRTLVHLMTRMLQPHEGESIYDPTSGSGGMLLSCAVEVKRQGGEWRTLRLYGQERNLLTSAIARMNLLLHGFEEFQIVRGNTLDEPKLLDGDRLRQFDVCLANPPYSIKAWNRAKWASDPYGRNQYGTPPQGRADYAFWQHILASLKPDTGRCAILFPHGVLFRDEERQMRESIIKADVIECVLGLGPNLFYNSPMEACVIVCRSRKAPAQKGKILFLDAVNEVTRERAQSFLTEGHQERIVSAYRAFADQDGFARVADMAAIEKNGWSLNMPLYVQAAGGSRRAKANAQEAAPLEEVLDDWLAGSVAFRQSLAAMLDQITSANTTVGEQERLVAITDVNSTRTTVPVQAILDKTSTPPKPVTKFSIRERIRQEIKSRYSQVLAKGHFRHSVPTEKALFPIVVWVTRGEIEARRIHTEPYDETLFWKVLVEARTMTKEKRDLFLPKLVAAAANSGVAIVFSPVRDRVHASGFTKWLTPTKALLQISDRHKFADSFWFTFFHEAAHIIRHDKNDEFLESKTALTNASPDKSAAEREANIFAEDMLIPRSLYAEMAAAKPKTAAEILSWAERLAVEPGVIVGRLHHERLLPKRACNDLRMRFE